MKHLIWVMLFLAAICLLIVDGFFEAAYAVLEQCWLLRLL